MPSATEPVSYFSFPAVLIILPLSIITQEIRNFSHSFFQNFNSWQIYHPEMIRLFPVKSTSLYDQDLLILQQIQCKFFIIYNVGAETHIGKHLDSFDIIFCDCFISAENHPANTESGDHMGFGKTAEGDAEQIRCQ